MAVVYVFPMDTGSGNTLFDRIANEVGHPSNAMAADEPGGVDVAPVVGAEVAPALPSSDVDAVETSVVRAGPQSQVVESTRDWPAPDVSTQMDRPSIAERQCSRSGCSDAAAVTLSYHYGQSQVWIDRLTPEREPHCYDMCDRHAEGLSVPRGWHLDDRRGARRGALIAV